MHFEKRVRDFVWGRLVRREEPCLLCLSFLELCGESLTVFHIKIAKLSFGLIWEVR